MRPASNVLGLKFSTFLVEIAKGFFLIFKCFSYIGWLTHSLHDYSRIFLNNHLKKVSISDEGDVEIVRETYERAVANVPISKDKHFWRRYIYLWINYAVYEELETQDIQRTREVIKSNSGRLLLNFLRPNLSRNLGHKKSVGLQVKFNT